MRIAKVLLVSALLILSYCAYSFSSPTRVLLTPKRTGGMSEVIPLSRCNSLEMQPTPGSKGQLYLLTYDTGAEASWLTGLQTGFHLGVWFQSPAACTLLEIHYSFANGGDVTYYVADPSDTIDFLNDYYEYHGGPNPSGPDPRESYLHPEEPQGVIPGGWDTLNVTGRPDVGTNIFYAAYIMNDGNSNPIIDPSVDPPYHTLMYRIPAGGTEYGWYTSWHHVYIRALVDLYENPPPVVESFQRLSDTYSTDQREVTAHVWDLGVPVDSSGVAVACVYYWIAPDTEPTDTLAMSLISGDSADGTWAVNLPPFSVGDEVTYYFNATDLQGRTGENSSSHTFTIRAGQPTAQVLFWNDDYYGPPYTHDPVGSVLPTTLYDYWDGSHGLPDSSVIGFGYRAILVNTWGGSGASGFVADTALIAQYLDNGGKLLISSQDLPGAGFGYGFGSFTTSPGEFCHDYLHMLGGVDDAATDTISVYYGVPGDAITDPFSGWPITVFPYGWAGAGYNYAGSVVPDTESVSIFHDLASDASGYRYGNGYQLVFLYWPLAYLVDGATGEEDTLAMNTLVRNILTWFGITGVSEQPSFPAQRPSFTLLQNHPNPFSRTTVIPFSLQGSSGAEVQWREGDTEAREGGEESQIAHRISHITLRVYDLSGRLVRTLVDNEPISSFSFPISVSWDGKDSSGNKLPSGIYLYRLTCGDSSATKKAILLR